MQRLTAWATDRWFSIKPEAPHIHRWSDVNRIAGNCGVWELHKGISQILVSSCIPQEKGDAPKNTR